MPRRVECSFMMPCGAVLRRCLTPLVAFTLVGCATGQEPTPGPAAPQLLPFTYAPRQDGAVNGGVRAILQDRSGDYWFGSHFEGVCRVGRDGVRHFTRADGLSDDQVRAIQEAPDGSIWFDNGVGVSRFDGKRITAPVDREHSLLSTWALAPDDLWFKSNGSIGFDGASFTTIDGARMGLREGEGMPHVRCVFEDSRGRVWIGNNGGGVVVVDGDATLGLAPLAGTGKALLRMGAPLTSSADVNRDRSLQRVFSIGEDRDGNIWIGTIDGGAWRYDGRGLRRFSASDGLTSASVMAIYCDRDGVLWLGGAGVFRFDGSRFERVR